MSDVSSENRKVDEFLETVDKLSQERQKDDKKRQWQLERDIDQLSEKSRSNSPSFGSERPSLGSRASSKGHEIKELVFNRTASARTRFQEKWRNKAPELPERPRNPDFGSDDEELAPSLPSRPGNLKLDRPSRQNGPKSGSGPKTLGIDLPVRRARSPKAPSLPKRPEAQEEEIVVDLGIKMPVARKSAPPIPASKPGLAEKSDKVDTDIAPATPKRRELPEFMKPQKGTFAAMEERIKARGINQAAGTLGKLEQKPELASEPSKPEKPEKPKRISSFEQKSTDKESSTLAAKSTEKAPPAAPKPRAATVRESPSASVSSSPRPLPSKPRGSVSVTPEPVSTKLAPPKPAKPSLKAYEEKDSQELKNRILGLSPTKPKGPPAKPEKKDFDSDQKDLLKSQLEKLSKKLPPAKPAKPSRKPSFGNEKEVEGINALHSLKPAKPAKSPEISKAQVKQPEKEAEGLSALHKLRPIKPASLKAPTKPERTPSEDPKSSFHAELSGIIRASTEPSMRHSNALSSSLLDILKITPPNLPIRRIRTDPAPSKIVHATKSRSKGPKRRLPKSVAGDNNLPTIKQEETKPPVFSGIGLKMAAFESDSQPENKVVKTPPPKPAKKPPPIKAKKPDILAKPRNVSGELFI